MFNIVRSVQNVYMFIMTSHERHGITNHWRFGRRSGRFSILFSATTNKTSKLCILAFCKEKPPTVEISPHKGSVMQKVLLNGNGGIIVVHAIGLQDDTESSYREVSYSSRHTSHFVSYFFQTFHIDLARTLSWINLGILTSSTSRDRASDLLWLNVYVQPTEYLHCTYFLLYMNNAIVVMVYL